MPVLAVVHMVEKRKRTTQSPALNRSMRDGSMRSSASRKLLMETEKEIASGREH